MELIDTHTHLYSEEFKDDIAQVMQNAANAHIKQFYMPAIDTSTHRAMIDLEAAYPASCKSMMGLHPCSVKEDYQSELAEVHRWLDKRPFIAIGEIGLDFYWDKTHIEQQYDVFKIQMTWALERNLPIVIHARDSMDACIETVRPFAKQGLTGIFHCFGGSTEQAKAIIELGFYLGIGGVFTFKKANMGEVLRDISLNHIVLETDSPYLAPVPFRGKRNESAYLLYIAEAVAKSKGHSLEEVADITSRNARLIFKTENS